MEPNYKIFSVDEDPLTDQICRLLGRVKNSLRMETFSDGEFSPQFQESIRNHQVFLVCSTNTPEKILKFLLSVDAAKRASASEIVAVIPYFGYSRQDRKEGARGAIGAKVMADLLSVSGIHRLITVDLHASQIQGFFDIPVDHLAGYRVFSDYLMHLPKGTYTICSPDAGGVKRASAMYNKFFQYRNRPGVDCDINFAMMSKRRDKPNSIESMELIGDVKGRQVILVDDMSDTAGTLIKAAEVLKQHGAVQVGALITHGVLSSKSGERILESSLDFLVTTDTLASAVKASQEYSEKINLVTCARSFADAIGNIANGKSLQEALS